MTVSAPPGVEVRHDADSRTFTLTFGDVTTAAPGDSTPTTKVSTAQLIWQPTQRVTQQAQAPADDVRDAAKPPLTRILSESTDEPPDTPTSPDGRKSQYIVSTLTLRRHIATTIKHRMSDRVKLSFVIFDIWALWARALQYFAKWAMHQSAPAIIMLQNVHPCQSVMKIRKCLYRLNCHKFGQLIIRKIVRILPLDVRFLWVNMYKIRLRLGLRLFLELTALLRWWSLQRSP